MNKYKQDFSGSSAGESACNAGDPGLIPRLGRSTGEGIGYPLFTFVFFQTYYGEGNGTPLQYSCLENPMGRGAWKAAVHGVARCRTRLSNFTFTFHFHALEKVMAIHSSVLAWGILGMGQPGGLPSLGLHRVRHD